MWMRTGDGGLINLDQVAAIKIDKNYDHNKEVVRVTLSCGEYRDIAVFPHDAPGSSAKIAYANARMFIARIWGSIDSDFRIDQDGDD